MNWVRPNNIRLQSPIPAAWFEKCTRLRVSYHGRLNSGGRENFPISNHLHPTTQASMSFSVSTFSAPTGALPLCSHGRRIPNRSSHVSVSDILNSHYYFFNSCSVSHLPILLPSCLIFMKDSSLLEFLTMFWKKKKWRLVERIERSSPQYVNSSCERSGVHKRKALSINPLIIWLRF